MKNRNPLDVIDVEERIRKISVEQMGIRPSEVKRESNFVGDFGADSLDCVELAMAIEEEFGIEIPDNDMDKLQTVGQVIEYVAEKI